MKKKIIVRIAEGIGNQLFIYAHAFALSKKSKSMLSYSILGLYRYKHIDCIFICDICILRILNHSLVDNLYYF